MKTTLFFLISLFSITSLSAQSIDSLSMYSIKVNDTLDLRIKDFYHKARNMKTYNLRADSYMEEYDVQYPKYIPKSPNVSSLVQNVDIPVSHYSGTPNISIPIYELEIDGFKLPITLSYNSSGIRVSQESSWVGLGWNLDVGGVISRTVKCGDDFQEYSPPNHIEKGYLTAPTPVHIDSIAAHFGYFYVGASNIVHYLKADTEPDIFSYSLPRGGDKFLIDKYRGVVLFDRTKPIRIDLITENGSKFFQLTEKDGTIYQFKQKEKTSTYSRPGNITLNNPNAVKFDDSEEEMRNNYTSPFQYTSSWFLTKIITNTNREIIFNYSSESYLSPTQENLSKYVFLSGTTSWEDSDPLTYNCNKTMVESFRLNSIVWDGGEIMFESSYREDVIGNASSDDLKKLDAIKVTNKNGVVVRHVRFNYDYFNNDYSGNYPHVFKRLKLLSVCNLLDSNDKYSFVYDEVKKLPAKNSKNTDYWGYSNGINQGSVYCSPANYLGKIYSGADKTPYLPYTRSAVLTAINYPTGGSSRFTYEANQYKVTPTTSVVTHQHSTHLNVYKEHNFDTYSNYPQYQSDTISLQTITDFEIIGFAENEGCQPDPDIQYNDENYTVFRISRINANNTQTQLIAYHVPEELRDESCSFDYPILDISLAPGTYIFEAMAQAKDVWFCIGYTYEKTEQITSDSIVNGGGLRIAQVRGAKELSYTYDGGTLLVSPVTHYFYSHHWRGEDSSYKIGNYLVQLSESTIPMSTLKNGYTVGYGIVREKYYDGYTEYRFYNDAENLPEYPFIPSELNLYNGLPISVSRYDNNGTFKQRTSYTYDESVPDRMVHAFCWSKNEDQIHSYCYTIGSPLLVREETLTHEENGNHTTSFDYSYNDDFLLRDKVWYIDDAKYTQENIYSTEFSDSISKGMTSRYMIALPIEKRLLKNGQVIRAKKTEYTEISNCYLPVSESELRNISLLDTTMYRNKYQTQLCYSAHNAYGKPMQITDKGENTVYLWSYRGQYPVAEIKNVTFQQLTQFLPTVFINQLAEKDMPTNDDMRTLDNLRIQLPYSSVSTYTYEPLVGMTTMTNERGFTTYYEYDTSGRLSTVYIKHGTEKQVLKRYDYHYKEK